MASVWVAVSQLGVGVPKMPQSLCREPRAEAFNGVKIVNRR